MYSNLNLGIDVVVVWIAGFGGRRISRGKQRPRAPLKAVGTPTGN
jgi:hypothetical protein